MDGADGDGEGASNVLQAGALQTKALYIDTSTRYSLNFNWDGAVFSALKNLCQSGELELKETLVGSEEMASKLREKVETARQSLEKARKQISILKQVPEFPHAALSDFNFAEALEALSANATAYFQACGAENISLDSGTVEELMKQYFAGVPPFGEGRKKAEFPDAAVIAALRKWCADHDAKIYMVSEDADFKAACELDDNLIYSSSLEEIISTANGQLEFAQEIETALGTREDELLAFIAPDFEYLGFVLQDENGDVNAAKATGFHLERAYVLRRDEETLVVELQGTIDFVADISYDDLSTAMWDSEDKKLYAWHTIEAEVERETEARIEVTCGIDDGDIDTLEIESVIISDPVDVYFSAHEVEHY